MYPASPSPRVPKYTIGANTSALYSVTVVGLGETEIIVRNCVCVTVVVLYCVSVFVSVTVKYCGRIWVCVTNDVTVAYCVSVYRSVTRTGTETVTGCSIVTVYGDTAETVTVIGETSVTVCVSRMVSVAVTVVGMYDISRCVTVIGEGDGRYSVTVIVANGGAVDWK